MTTIVDLLPNDYGFVPLAVSFSYIGIMSLGGKVMAARKRHGVDYPHMYATLVDVDGKPCTNAKSPECAEKFNSAQRGHQNALENHYAVLVMTVLGGLALPRVASASLLLWTFGAMTYASQYAEKGPSHRNNGLALMKYVGLLGLLAANIMLSYSIFTK